MKECALRHPYQTCAKMSDIEKVKADMEAMNEQMTTIMEEMMRMKKMIEVKTATVAAASTATEMDPIHPPSFNQVSRPVSDVVGQ